MMMMMTTKENDNDGDDECSHDDMSEDGVDNDDELVGTRNLYS